MNAYTLETSDSKQGNRGQSPSRLDFSPAFVAALLIARIRRPSRKTRLEEKAHRPRTCDSCATKSEFSTLPGSKGRKSPRLIATLAITRDANRGVSKLSMIRDADEGGKQRSRSRHKGARRVAAAECGRTKLYREGGRRAV